MQGGALHLAPSFERLRSQIRAAAQTDAKVLILGETGVGKDVVARLIHDASARRAEPFIAVNCCGIPETLLESELFGHVRGSFTGAFRDKVGLAMAADRGTLFLDEVGEMSLRMQGAVLRLADTGEIQPIGADGSGHRTRARLVAATNRDLQERIASHAFRQDLYYRLRVVEITVPPLRERRDDILFLLDLFLEKASATHRLPCPVLTAAAREALQAYSWTGNVRELRNLAERLVVRALDRVVDATDLPGEISGWAHTAQPVATGEPKGGAVDAPNPDDLWTQLRRGGTFWTVVHTPFRHHDLTRADVRRVIARALLETRGNYRAILPLLNLRPTDYKRLLAFLEQHDCRPDSRAHPAADPSRPPTLGGPRGRWEKAQVAR